MTLNETQEDPEFCPITQPLFFVRSRGVVFVYRNHYKSFADVYSAVEALQKIFGEPVELRDCPPPKWVLHDDEELIEVPDNPPELQLFFSLKFNPADS